MDIRQIERLMRAMRQHGVKELILSDGDFKLSLERGEIVSQALPADAEPVLSLVPDPPAKAEAGGDGKEILSPMVGTFHANPKRPIKPGAKLKKGDVLCVIEAMKLMNDIAMEEDGEITFVALNEGDMVEFGQLIATYK